MFRSTPASAVSPSPPAASRGGRAVRGDYLRAAGAGALLLVALAAGGLLLSILVRGTAALWPARIDEVRLRSGETLLGIVSGRWTPEAVGSQTAAADGPGVVYRVHGLHESRVARRLVPDAQVSSRAAPAELAQVELQSGEWFAGRPVGWVDGGRVETADPEAVWQRFTALHAQVRARSIALAARHRALARSAALELERARTADRRADEELSALLYQQRFDAIRAARSEADPAQGKSASTVERNPGGRYSRGVGTDAAPLEAAAAARTAAAWQSAAQAKRTLEEAHRSFLRTEERAEREAAELFPEKGRYQLELADPLGRRRFALEDVSLAFQPNRLGFFGGLGVFLHRGWALAFGDGGAEVRQDGFSSALWGTVTLTLLMLLFVVPAGATTALYLHEYSRPGPATTLVRVAVHNLSSIPSIVWGVFGLIFFCNLLGVGLDQLFFAPRKQWEHQSTLGGPCVLWASLTLSLLVAPTVIQATERALAAVPRSAREASWACGATQWQTILRIVLPSAWPGIAAAAFFAVARGVGQIAPLILVGGARWVPDPPMDLEWPFLHGERNFLHLGFLVLSPPSLGQDLDAARALVDVTILVWVGLILAMNVGARLLLDWTTRRSAYSPDAWE